MFRSKITNLKDHYQSNFDVATKWLNEGSPTCVIAAYKLLSDIYAQYPEKAVQGQLGEAKLKLKQLGLLDQVLADEKKSGGKNSSFISGSPTNSKL